MMKENTGEGMHLYLIATGVLNKFFAEPRRYSILILVPFNDK
jgi:hypothetical protein